MQVFSPLKPTIMQVFSLLKPTIMQVFSLLKPTIMQVRLVPWYLIVLIPNLCLLLFFQFFEVNNNAGFQSFETNKNANFLSFETNNNAGFQSFETNNQASISSFETSSNAGLQPIKATSDFQIINNANLPTKCTGIGSIFLVQILVIYNCCPLLSVNHILIY